MISLKENSKLRTYNYKHSGKVEYQEFYPDRSKDYIDEIDYLLAKHYNFTAFEIDFLVNYDIKYRMGLDSFEKN